MHCTHEDQMEGVTTVQRGRIRAPNGTDSDDREKAIDWRDIWEALVTRYHDDLTPYLPLQKNMTDMMRIIIM